MSSIETQLSSQHAAQQLTRRQGLWLQLRAIVFPTRQGIAIRGHCESEGNLLQLMHTWSKDNNILQSYLQYNRYISHQAVNEIIEILVLTVLRTLLNKVKSVAGAKWFSIDAVLPQFWI